VLVIPMSIFQFSSASLDGISTALAIFSIAAFLHIAKYKDNAKPTLFYALALSVILVATSRIHLLPLLALLLAACIYLKKKKFFYVFVFSFLFVLAWTIIAVKTTVGWTVVGTPPAQVALFYLRNPSRFLDVLAATVSNRGIIKFYVESFFGILGWLDTRFSASAYMFLSICTAWIGVLSVSIKNLRTDWIPRLAVFLSALASIFLILFALLVTSSQHPANLIQGVQGRYFLVPAIMVAYAISGSAKINEGVFRKFSIFLLIALGAFTFFSTPRLLIERYYLAVEQPPQVVIAMHPSAALGKNSPITLLMSKGHENHPRPLKRIGIQFGTYMRKNPGRAELQLSSSDGHALAIPFNLPDLDDNQYRFFELDSKPYTMGKIVYLTGGGISTWEAHEDNGGVATCLIFEYENNNELYTRGCPRP
jgi:hypothetical protein